MINLKVEDIDKSTETAIKKIKQFDAKRGETQRKILARFAEYVIRLSQDKFLNAPQGDRDHLHSRSGKLSSSVRYWIQGDDTAIVGSNLIYAAIHEFGGIILPINASMLSWVPVTLQTFVSKKTGKTKGKWTKGDRVFAKMVKMPARPYLRPAIDALFDEGHAERIAEMTLIEAIRQEGLE